MTLSLQGFEKALNLVEATADGDILNNLGGGSISNDIALFTNNKKNTSTLVWQANTNQSSITNNRFVFPTTVQAVFTNGDQVTVSGTPNLNPLITHFVVGLQVGLGVRREQSAFGLSTTKGGSLVSLAGIDTSVTFIRNDEVSRENLDNITTPSSLEIGSTNEDGRFSYDIGGTFTEAFDVIDGHIDTSSFLRTLKYTSDTSIATDRRVSVEGTIVSSDPALTNTSIVNLARPNSPGIYITDPFSDVDNITKVRAYSTSAQAWSIAGNSNGTGSLVTKSKEVNVGDLLFESGIKIAEFDGLSSIQPRAVSEFTHKLPVVIDGVEYFVLAKVV